MTNDSVTINWVDGELKAEYQCPFCKLHLQYPVQFENCGHFVCANCLQSIMRETARCPTCQQTVSNDKIYHHRAMHREVQNLEIFCAHRDNGCIWQGTLHEYQCHKETCQFMMVECQNHCGQKLERRFILKHQYDVCPKRVIPCEFCATKIAFEDQNSHLNICLEVKITCPNKCSSITMPRKHLQSHFENDCPIHELFCPFKEFGCDFRSSRLNITAHMTELLISHLNLIGKAVAIQDKSIKSHEEYIKEHHSWIKLLGQNLNTLQKTYGANFIWKIDHYQKRLQEARSGKNTTLFSPQFATSRHGYRLSLSICLCGDGKAKGKYVSLFICICRGEYDALLVWPFSHRITFTLLDQCEDIDSRRHVTHSFKPNICKENRPFLNRPMTERNVSFGAQKFIELDKMETLEYIKNDTVFIKVEIDDEDMIII